MAWGVHPDDIERRLDQLLGVRVTIDDFGAGNLSLRYLQRLPIDDLKIDRCFVSGIHRDASTQPLVKAIAGLAHGLNSDGSAEGVETETELAVLRDLGCDQVQGFLLGRPEPPQSAPHGGSPKRSFSRRERTTCALFETTPLSRLFSWRASDPRQPRCR